MEKREYSKPSVKVLGTIGDVTAHFVPKYPGASDASWTYS